MTSFRASERALGTTQTRRIIVPYVLMQVTREGVSLEQKEDLIKGVTNVLVRVLDKKPHQTFVVIQEIETDNWGIAGMTVTNYRRETRSS
jgi:4-oxalocrotonate tautomerase